MEIDQSMRIWSDISSAAAEKKTNKSLGMDDFLYLLSAQMSNQDMMNPMSDTEFMNQLAQFTTLQAIQEMNELSTTSYSTSLLGKEVTVARIGATGQLTTETGIVTGVGLFSGEPVIYIGENAYSLSEIMVVGTMPAEAAAPEETNPDDTLEGGEGGETEVEEGGATPQVNDGEAANGAGASEGNEEQTPT